MAQTPGAAPTYAGGSPFQGLRGTRHKAYLKTQPAGGDYGVQGAGESDIDANGNAEAWVQAVAITNAAGQIVNPTSNYNGTPLGYQQIAAATMQTAQLLTVPATATYCVIEPEAGDVRWRDDGTNPTTTVGVPLPAGSQLVYAASLAAIKFIDVDANGILNISYYK